MVAKGPEALREAHMMDVDARERSPSPAAFDRERSWGPPEVIKISSSQDEVESRGGNDTVDNDIESDHEKHQSDAEQEDDSQDPQSPLEAFDWSDIDQRFQVMVQERDGIEDDLLLEFNELMEVRKRFRIDTTLTLTALAVLQDMGSY